MTYINLPHKDGWCVEGYIKDKKPSVTRYYFTSDVETKEAAKQQFLKDTSHLKTEFEKIDVLECLL